MEEICKTYCKDVHQFMRLIKLPDLCQESFVQLPFFICKRKP